MTASALPSALEIADNIRSGTMSALEVVEATLASIASVDPQLRSFTAVTSERARDEARAVDALRHSGSALPLLAGVPYAVKNLFDVVGIAAFRAPRSMSNLARTVHRSMVTTFGADFATVNIEFVPSGTPETGRQNQTWVRFSEGWRIVAAHVSLLPEESPQ